MCDTAGHGKCDQCDDGYGVTTRDTCAPVSLLDARALRLALACSIAARVLRRLSPGVALHGPQCAAHCVNCDPAGECYQCEDGYGLTTGGTCALVSSLHARALRLALAWGLTARKGKPRVSQGSPSIVVCCPLQVLRHSGARQVRSMLWWLRPDCKRHVRSGARACCQSMGAAACPR